MKNLLVSSILIATVLCSCSQKKQGEAKIVEVGDMDSSAIAQDTSMQLAFENSYEYSKTLNVSKNLAFDVRAYGGSASKGEFAIIRRGADNKPDTIFKSERNGVIMDSWASDLNGNGEPEVMVITQTTGENKKASINAIEVTAGESAKPILYSTKLLKELAHEYKGNDSIYYVKGEGIYHRFPLDDGGIVTAKYGLKGNKFEPEKFEVERNTK